MRGKSTGMSASEIVGVGWNVMQDGFQAIDPFMSYKEEFAHYSDIKETDDKNWKTYTNEKGTFFKNKYFNIVPSISQCKDQDFYFFVNSKTTGSYTKKGYKTLFIQYPVYYLSTFLHELGHALCILDDEYVYKPSKFLFIQYYPKASSIRNCRVYPASFGHYGDENFKGCTNPWFYRSTVDSIMRYSPFVNKFNIISCGYCLNKIKGSKLDENFKECSLMDVIKPGKECLVDYDCSLDGSFGCRICGNSKCYNAPAGSLCQKESKEGIVNEKCNSKGICEI